MILVSIFESFNTAFTDMVFSSVGITQRIGLLGVILFILVEIGLTILRFFNGTGESFPNFQKPLSYIVLFFFLLSYVPVMRTFDSLINVIEGYIRQQGDTDYSQLSSDLILLKNIQNAPVLKKAADDAGALEEAWTGMQNSWEQMKASFQSTIEFFTFSVPALLFASIADGITGIIRYLVELLSVLLTGVLIIVGPLAAMFQTAPYIGEGILKNWFSTWLSIKCWTITMSISDMMMHKFLILFTNQDRGISEFFMEDLGGTALWLQVINLSFILLFIMTPMITNYYVKGGGGAFMSKMIGAATTVVHAATGVATMGSSSVAQKAIGALSEKVDALSKKLHASKN